MLGAGLSVEGHRHVDDAHDIVHVRVAAQSSTEQSIEQSTKLTSANGTNRVDATQITNLRSRGSPLYIMFFNYNCFAVVSRPRSGVLWAVAAGKEPGLPSASAAACASGTLPVSRAGQGAAACPMWQGQRARLITR